MKLSIKITYKTGEIGTYEGIIHHLHVGYDDDKHTFSGYWPPEDIVKLGGVEVKAAIE